MGSKMNKLNLVKDLGWNKNNKIYFISDQMNSNYFLSKNLLSKNLLKIINILDKLIGCRILC